MDPQARPASKLMHWAASSARQDPSAAPLIAAGSVVGMWPLQHAQAVTWHDHDFYEVAFITAGTGLHFTDVREIRIDAGSVIFVPPGTSHGYRALKGVVIYNCFFRAELADFELLWAARDRGLTELFGKTGSAFREPGAHVVTRLDPPDFDACIAQLDAIRLMDPAERSHANEMGHLLLALDIVARRGHRDARPGAPPIPSQTSRVVSQAMELIERDLGHPWTLDELAAAVFVTKYHLAHQFKLWLGMPPGAYIVRRRAEHAAFLLKGTDQVIASIGRTVGWPQPTAFSHQFRRAYGVSPRTYRQRSRAAVEPGAES